MKFAKLIDSVIIPGCSGVCIPLTEANLNRITRGHDDSGYIIISPCRSAVNLQKEIPLDYLPNEQQTTDINNLRLKELKKYLKEKGYAYVSLFGGYHENGAPNATYEKSFVVYPFNREFKDYVDFDVMYDDMLNQATGYCQDSMLVKRPEKPAAQVITSPYTPERIGEIDMEFSGLTMNDVAKEYFTALKKHKEGSKDSPQRFSFEGLYINPAGSLMEGHHRSSCGELVLINN